MRTWAVLGAILGILGRSWGALGLLSGCPWLLFGDLGAAGSDFESIWGRLGIDLGWIWDRFGLICWNFINLFWRSRFDAK